MEQSHYYRQWWYWGGEAALRVNGEKMQLTSIPDEEWAQVETAAKAFWAELTEGDPIREKVVGIIQEYNDVMQKAGRPYRYDT